MGGIVHDFNNLLTVLVGNLYLVAEGVRDNPALFDQTKRARDVAKRGADLIRQLLAFSRKDQLSTKTLDTKKVISNLESLLEHTLGSHISLELDLEPDTAFIDASAAQLESVVVNLVVNAKDAIEGDGSITVATRNLCIDERRTELRGVAPGRYVSISVADDGCGIPELLQQRVFEPYFSTKDGQRGTGLGLSMVRQFAEQCGGDVHLSSRPGVGTKITLRLPVSRGSPADSSVMTMPLRTLPSGNERVLILAGDAELSNTVEQSLRMLGYATHLHTSHDDLARLLSAETFSLLIVDSSAGTDAERDSWFTAIRNRHPSIAVLLIDSGAGEPPHGLANTDLLKKPFALKDLAEMVRRLLDRCSDV